MTRNKFMTADAAVMLIKERDTVALIGGGGACRADPSVPSDLPAFPPTGFPRNLTVLHALGIGDKKTEGMNYFAHEGLVKRVIGGHWVWSPKMQEMARDEKIKHMSAKWLRDAALSRDRRKAARVVHPCRPRHLRRSAPAGRQDEQVRQGGSGRGRTIGGHELLWYKSFPINVAIIRGSFGDPDGNISLDQEAANIDIYAAALAAQNQAASSSRRFGRPLT